MLIHVCRVALILVLVAVGSPVPGQFIIAHRGASYDAPENTLAAFCLAWEQGADGVEADFHLSADGHVVCIHDKDTQRVAGDKLVVKDTTLRKLQSLDVGRWKDACYRGERIPTLEQVLTIVPPGKMIFIELKTGPEIVEPTAAFLLRSKLSNEQVVFISFNADTIAQCKRSLPHIKAHWLTGYKKQDGGHLAPTAEQVLTTLKECGADGLGSKAMPNHVDSSFLSQLAMAGFPEFHVWTVDHADTAVFYQQLGAWSITTNRPGWLRDHIDTARSDSSANVPK